MSHLFLFVILVFSDPSNLGLQNYQSEFLNLINEKRRIGCKCNGVKYSKLPPLVWNKQLEIARQAWIESPSHCQNLMGNYSEMAITKKGDYWVQDFGTPKILKK